MSPKRRADFLDAALKLFVKNGIEGTSTAAIAREAGSAAGTLFIYFPTKQALINELVLDIGRQQAGSTKARLRPEMDAREMFQAIWHSSLDWFVANPEAFLFIQQVRESAWVPAEVVQESQAFFDYYFTAIAKGLAGRQIKPYPLELIGGIVYQDIVAVMNLIQRQPDPSLHDEYRQAGFAIFWDGIKAGQE